MLAVEDDHLGPVAGATLHTIASPAARAGRRPARSPRRSVPTCAWRSSPATRRPLARVQGRQRCGPGWVSHVLQASSRELWTDPRRSARSRGARETPTPHGASACSRALAGVGVAGARRLRARTCGSRSADEAGVVARCCQRGWVVAPGAPLPAGRQRARDPRHDRDAARARGRAAGRRSGRGAAPGTRQPQRIADDGADAERIRPRPSPRRAPARYACCAACSSRAPTPSRRCRPRPRELDPRDRALAMRLAYGAVQRTRHARPPDRAARRAPRAKLDPPCSAPCGSASTSCSTCGGSPDYAVVADAVELAKSGGRARPRARQRRAAPRRARGRRGAARLARRRHARARPRSSTPIPQWIARLWWEELGAEQARALMAADNEPGEVALRANTLADRRRGARRASCPCARTATPTMPEALVLEEAFDAHGSPLWGDGAFIAQSRAAMLVARALAPRARRAGARPLRRARRQEHPPGGADGGRGRAARRRAQPAQRGARCAHRRAHARQRT